MLLCMAMVATMAVGCSSGGAKDDGKDTAKTEEKKETDEVSADTVFGKALAQVNEDLAPLPEKDTGKKLAAPLQIRSGSRCRRDMKTLPKSMG